MKKHVIASVAALILGIGGYIIGGYIFFVITHEDIYEREPGEAYIDGATPPQYKEWEMY